MIILDASAGIELFTRSQAGVRVHDLIADERVTVPAHFDVEIGSALRRMVRQRRIGSARAEEAVRLSVGYPAERAAITPLVIRAFALRDRFSAGDALYALLAKDLGATLVTCDVGLANASEGFAPVRHLPVG